MTAIWSQKNCFAANWKEKKLVHKSLELEKYDDCYLEQEKNVSQLTGKEKSGSLLLGVPKLYFTTLWSKQKGDDCYFKSEKLVYSYLEYDKNGSQLFVG